MLQSAKLDEDSKIATIELTGDRPISIRMDAAALDNLLLALGKLRAEMLPGVEKPVLGAVYEGIIDPAWQTGYDAMADGVDLSLRHPGFGWIHFVLPRHEALAIARVLSNIEAVRPLEAEPRPKN